MLAQQQPIAVAEKEAALTLCRHHWIIEPANGPVSRGVCRNCHETPQFRKYVDDQDPELQSDPV